MYISHKSNIIQHIVDVEWECRRFSKGLTIPEYWAWVDTIKTTTGKSEDGNLFTTEDYSGETGYTIVECTDENVEARLVQLDDYVSNLPEGITYNIKYYASKRDSEIVDVPAHKDDDENDVAETYVQSHFIGDDTVKDARILAEEWTQIRTERDRLLTS